jgi:hypothetical protein
MTSAVTPVPMGRPASASLIYVVSAASMLLVLALFVTGRGAFLRLVIPAAAVLVGLAFYFRRPVAYFQFTLWTWFLTPLVRRLVDWRVGFEDHNLVLLTPLLVSAIAGLILLREQRPAAGVRLTPFLLCIAGVLYGFGVGLLRSRLHAPHSASPGEIIYGLFEWLAPLFLGLHLYLGWPMYEEYKRAMQKSFLWALLILGAYGVYQYVHPPAWDTLWLGHMMTDLGDQSFGRPEPFQVRVWSTLNSPGVCGTVLMVGLLLLFCVKSRIKPLAMGAGYSAFLLTLVRTSWLGWLVGIAVLARNSKGRQISRLLITLLLIPIFISPIMLIPQVSTVITSRVQTLQSTGQDESFHDRMEEYRVLLTSLAADPFGEGLSNAETFHGYIMDSGIIRLFYYCGWIGAALFLAGIALCAVSMASGQSSADPLAPASRAVIVAMMFELLSGNIFTGPSGALLWICIGLGMSLKQMESVPSLFAEQVAPLEVEVHTEVGVTA